MPLLGSRAVLTPTLLACYAITAAVHVASIVLNTLLPLHVADLGGTKTQVGLLFSVMTVVSMFLRPTVGGWVDRFGAQPVIAPGIAALALTALLLQVAMTPLAIIVLSLPAGAAGLAASARAPRLISRSAVPVSCALVLSTIGHSYVFAFLPLYALGRGQTAALAWFFAVYPAWLITWRALLRGVSDRLGHLRVGVFAMSVVAVAYLIIALPPTPLSLALAALVLASGNALLYPTLAALVVERAPESERGLALGTLSGAWDLGVVVGSALIGVVADRYSYGAGFAVGGAFAAIGVVALALSVERRTTGARYVDSPKSDVIRAEATRADMSASVGRRS